MFTNRNIERLAGASLAGAFVAFLAHAVAYGMGNERVLVFCIFIYGLLVIAAGLTLYLTFSHYEQTLAIFGSFGLAAHGLFIVLLCTMMFAGLTIAQRTDATSASETNSRATRSDTTVTQNSPLMAADTGEIAGLETPLVDANTATNMDSLVNLSDSVAVAITSNALIVTQELILSTSFVFLGIGMLALGVLIVWSGIIARWLGWFGGVGGFIVCVRQLAEFVGVEVGGAAEIFMIISFMTGLVFMFILGVRLLMRETRPVSANTSQRKKFQNA